MRARRGNTAIIVALTLVVLLGVAAVVVDIGYARLVRQQLQNAADAAAFAAAARIDGTAAGLADARATALWIASENHAGGQPVDLDENAGNGADGDVVFGAYDEATGAFTPSSDEDEVDAVRINAHVPALGLFVAPIALGRDALAVNASASTFVERGGAGAVDCYIPLGMPSCLVSRYGTGGLQNVVLKVNPAGIDNVGWARANGSPNANWTRDQIGSCTQGGTAAIGDPLGLQNGVVTTAMSALVTAVEGSSTLWSRTKWGTIPARAANSSISAAKYGRTYEGVVPVFDGGSSYCTGSGGSFNQSKPIVGFVWGAIYDVVNSGASNKRTIYMRLDFTETYNVGTRTGGPSWAVTSNRAPRLVTGG